ncbi:MAG: DNA repair protein RecO [Chloroflexota bacterium]|nr:DNA repair protein RecO [Chloroflexota bacterium]
MPRQRLYRTPAVILKRMDLGEADRIVTFYSRDVGKIRAVAKGVRRTTSRSAGHLEPFTLSDVMFAVGRELDVISQADTLEAFRAIREDLVLTTHAYYLAEMVDLLTEDRMENRAVFDVLVDGLRDLQSAVAGADAEAGLVLIVFHLRLLEALGYRPELRECVTCRVTIEPERNQFSAAMGGVLCPVCGPHESSARSVGTSVLKLLRFVQHSDGRRSVVVPTLVAREAEVLLRAYAEHIVERRLRSPALIARIQQASL